MTTRILLLSFTAFLLAACGRQGDMLRPEPGVTIMKEADKPAENAVDNPFVLDKLL
jgi:predicted small lipoprotein YifL